MKEITKIAGGNVTAVEAKGLFRWCYESTRYRATCKPTKKRRAQTRTLADAATYSTTITKRKSKRDGIANGRGVSRSDGPMFENVEQSCEASERLPGYAPIRRAEVVARASKRKPVYFLWMVHGWRTHETTRWC